MQFFGANFGANSKPPLPSTQSGKKSTNMTQAGTRGASTVNAGPGSVKLVDSVGATKYDQQLRDGIGTKSVGAGLSSIGGGVEEPVETGKSDARLLAYMEAESDALADTGVFTKLFRSGETPKAVRMVNLIDLAMRMDHPEEMLASSFSKYLNQGTPGGIAIRVQKLSQEVHDYVQARGVDAHTTVLTDALRTGLKSLPLLDDLDRQCMALHGKSRDSFFKSELVIATSRLQDGSVNPYLFDRDRTQGTVSRDITDLVASANEVLTSKAGTQSYVSIDTTRELVQAKSWAGAESVFDQLERFEQIDLKIKPGEGVQNAYAILGLPMDVTPAALNNYMSSAREAEHGTAISSDVRNARFLLQTPKSRAEYDLYLQAKDEYSATGESGVGDLLKSTCVTEEESRAFGTFTSGFRMQMLNQALSDARDAIGR